MAVDQNGLPAERIRLVNLYMTDGTDETADIADHATEDLTPVVPVQALAPDLDRSAATAERRQRVRIPRNNIHLHRAHPRQPRWLIHRLAVAFLSCGLGALVALKF
jgi:hypothetical protein